MRTYLINSSYQQGICLADGAQHWTIGQMRQMTQYQHSARNLVVFNENRSVSLYNKLDVYYYK